VFKVAQHSRDEELLKSFISFFGCGSYYKRPNAGDFICKNFSGNLEKILPFFQKYPILGVKALDFKD
jgi:hypothetical protein